MWITGIGVTEVRRGAWLACAVVLALAGGVGCAADDEENKSTVSTAALVVSSDDALSFETTAAWSTAGATASSTSIRTEGAAAYQLDAPAQLVKVVSVPLASTATALAGLGETGSQLAIDVMIPAPPLNDSNPGSLQILMSSPSRGLNRVTIGQVSLVGVTPLLWKTLKFPIPDDVRTALSAAPFQDLTVSLYLHTPGTRATRQNPVTYRLDHLRVYAPSAAPPGVNASVDLVALRTYVPPSNSPGSASFDAGIVQVPASFHVKSGSAGTGKTTLELGFANLPSLVTCTYGGAAGGASYDWESCTGGARPGDLVGAAFARLTILGGDSAAGPTKIRAQLALNPVGDVAGSGVIPPMPTFWGDTPASANQIVTAYFDAVHAIPPTDQLQIFTPVPDFARRAGDGSPNDNLIGPPANPDDPPFDQEGHLNAGGNWDAYWRLSGNVTPTRTAANRFTNHFEATLGANAVLWGYDVSLVSVRAQADSDSGEIAASGLNQPTASGSVKLFLLGIEIVKREATPESQFTFEENYDRTFTIVTVQIWIFSVSLKAHVTAGFTASGAVTPVDVAFLVRPQGSLGAILEGGVNIGVASGTVAAEIDLLRLSAPVRARATWFISTDPTICSVRLFGSLTGDITLSSLGGKVDLKAKFGVCPICYEDSYNIIKWDPLLSHTYSLFNFSLDGQLFPLPAAACVSPLTVTISKPVDAESVSAGVPYALQGKAVRPATPGVDEQAIDCQYLTWTSSSASDTGFPASGCTPLVTFGDAGSRTLTLTATAPSGETGSSTRTFDVVAAPSGPSPFISSPATGSVFGIFSCSSGNVSLVGGSVGGTGTVSLKWTITSLTGGGALTITNDTSSTATLNLPATPGGQEPEDYLITLTATDQDNLSNSASITITTSCFL